MSELAMCGLQEREVLTCRSKYGNLSSTCSETGDYNLTGKPDVDEPAHLFMQ